MEMQTLASGFATSQETVARLPVTDLRPSPENTDLYDTRTDANFCRLFDDIRDHGVREPLVVTMDGFIVAGHRRFRCAELLGLREVPCTVLPQTRSAWSEAEYLGLLRVYNTHRDKTLSEQVREALVDANPVEAHRELERLRLRDGFDMPETVDIKPAPRRSEITDRTQPLLDAIVSVVNARRPFWGLSERKIHYCLLEPKPVYGNATKRRGGKQAQYGMDDASYAALSDVLSRALLRGYIPWEAIVDETRPDYTPPTFDSVREYVCWEAEQLFGMYVRNKLRSQEAHVELVVEKNTLMPVVKPIATYFGLVCTALRGQCSMPPRRKMFSRFARSGKRRMVVLTITDLDPAGIDIEQTIGWSLRDEFGITDLDVVRVAITPEQVRKLGLPPSGEVKATASNGPRFIEQYGHQCWEVEAMDEAQLQEFLTESLKAVIDVDLFNRELEQEQREALELRTIREAVRQFIAKAATELDGGPANA